MVVLFNFPTKVCKGIIKKITPTMINPAGPKRLSKIAIMPRKAKGATKDGRNIHVFASMLLKSFDSKFIIFPNYEDLAVYCEILDSFLYIKNTN